MKNLFITILLVSLMVTGFISRIQAERASMDEARTVAENWIALIVNIKGHWGNSTVPFIREIQEFKNDQKILGYVCHVEPKGFIVVSLHKELAPVKAYSTNSNIDLQSEEGLADLIKGRMVRIVNVVEKRIGPMALAKSQDVEEILEINYRRTWDQFEIDAAAFRIQLESGEVLNNYQGGDIMLTSAWNQDWPYNSHCPNYNCPKGGLNGHAYAGCVAIAGAQTMRHWNWPPYGVDSPYDDLYDWLNMPDLLSTNSPLVEINAVAELIHEVGLAADMDYGCDASGAYFADVMGDDLRDAFEEHFRYNIGDDAEERDDYSADGWFNLIRWQLSLNRPLPYKIPGHAIVVDGWQEVYIGGQLTKQYHMNWGHGPSYSYGKTWWYTLDEIYESDPDDEEVLMYLCPIVSLGNTIFGTYTRNASFPYRYFDQDALGQNATFEPGQNLQFLPRITVTGGASIRFKGASSANTILFARGDLSTGVYIYNGAIKLTDNGSIRFP